MTTPTTFSKEYTDENTDANYADPLTELGLSKYEARVYRTLLRIGVAPAKRVSDESDVPMGRIYDVLNDLQRRGLVVDDGSNHGKRYEPISAQFGLERLVLEKRRDAHDEVARCERIADSLESSLCDL